jgi:hypothetical protein
MKSPPAKKEPDLHRAALGRVLSLNLANPAPSRKRLLRSESGGLGNGQRRCMVCQTKVSNRNLGGHDGNSALCGPLFCLRCADEPIKRRSRRSRRRRRDSFHQQYAAIIDETRTLILALLNVLLEPASRTACTRLTIAGREIKRQCNRLAYKLVREAANS